MNETIRIGRRLVGADQPVYVVAEMSGNHQQRYDRAVKIVRAAKDAGADAIKLQTYTADTITISSDKEWFRIKQGTIWEGKNLHRLYQESYTPWEWQPRLMRLAAEVGLQCFSSPFDATAVEFLQTLQIPAYKVASFELVDLGLLRKIAATGKPVLVSTGMCSLDEIAEAVNTLRNGGAKQIALLKCTSAYPAPPEEMNLATISALRKKFSVPVGLSDHTMGIAVPVVAVALGACIVEKHLCLSRSDPGPDSAFSLEPGEFRRMVDAIRVAERAVGKVHFGLTPKEEAGWVFRRSLFVVRNIKAGEKLSSDNVRSIRPGYGLHTRHYEEVMGLEAAKDIERGTPLSWDLVRRRGLSILDSKTTGISKSFKKGARITNKRLP
jgi:pseudaminic acid synthase